MKTKVHLSPEEVKKKVVALRKKLEQAQRQAVEIEQKRREIYQQICDLQATCRHAHTANEMVHNIAEIKTRKFCTDCGAQC